MKPLALALVLLAAPARADVSAPNPGTQPPPASAERHPSGLRSLVLRKGTGLTHPGPRDSATVHYTGWTTDGKTFDSSLPRGPATFPLDAVIPGFREGVQLMVVGEKRRLWIPEALAYKGGPGRPAGILIFDVELMSYETRKR